MNTIWLVLCVFIFAVSTASAQSGPSLMQSSLELELPASVPPLPESGDLDQRFYLTKKNVSLFHEILLAPIAAWVKEGELISPIVKTLGFPWTLTKDWQLASTTNHPLFRLTETHDLVPVGEKVPSIGYPFGFASDIEQAEEKERGYRVLWNMNYAQAVAGTFLYEFEIGWVGSQSLLRKAKGFLFRHGSFVPALAETEGKKPAALADQFSQPGDFFWKEAMRFVSPPVVYGYGTVTERFRGRDEDNVWMHSPVTGRVRKVLSSNRGDSIVGSQLTFDDMFVWSNKIQQVKARVVAEKIILVPSVKLSRSDVAVVRRLLGPDSDKNPAKLEEDVLRVDASFKKSDSSPTHVLWNYETLRFRDAAPWTPVTSFMVPRKVWILELSPLDPFYPNGKEILAVDQESMLPWYKVVYDRRGVYKKTVVGAWSLAEYGANGARFPVLDYMIAVDAQDGPAAIFTTQKVQRYLDFSSERVREYLSFLNIENHKIQEAKEQEAS